MRDIVYQFPGNIRVFEEGIHEMLFDHQHVAPTPLPDLGEELKAAAKRLKEIKDSRLRMVFKCHENELLIGALIKQKTGKSVTLLYVVYQEGDEVREEIFSDTSDDEMDRIRSCFGSIIGVDTIPTGGKRWEVLLELHDPTHMFL